MDPYKLLKIIDNKVKNLQLASIYQSIELLLILILQIITQSRNEFYTIKQNILNNMLRKINNQSRDQQNNNDQISCLSKIDKDTCF